MESLVEIGLHNALLAVPLAVLALAAGLIVRRPALVHVLWILVLLRLLMPPLWRVELPRPFAMSDAAPPVAETAGAASLPAAKAQLADTRETRRFELPAVKPPTEPSGEATSPTDGTPLVASESAAPLPVLQDPPAVNALVALARSISWPQALGTAWLVSAFVLLTVSLRRMIRFSLAVRAARPAPDSVQRLALEIAKRMGVRRIPQIVMIRGNLSPMLWCCLSKPKVILPELLWRRLDPVQQSALLAHELAHFQRGDHWIRALELLAAALFWWHPVVWIARRQLREAEERCCDAWVIWALPEARRDYATALVDAAGFLSEGRSVLPAFASGVGQVRHLRGRLTMIMRGNTPRRLPRLVLAGLLTGGLALATLGAGFAQERRNERPGAERRPDAERRRDDERRAEDRLPPRDENDSKIREELEKARRNFEEARQRLDELERRFARGRERNRAPEGGERDLMPPPPVPPRPPAGGTGSAPRGPQPIERRMEDMERRMEMMGRQLEEMQRILRRIGNPGRGGRGEAERGGELPARPGFPGEPGPNVPRK
jgi:beta-lactamase regulating signal transducer with metallopeptidase domain